MFADTNFAALCPDVKVAEYCLSPPADGVCCGICPNTGISGLAGHISLAFTTLASIAAIAIAPSSAPVTLLNTLIQADAYAIVLVGYTLTGSGELDFFHAGYALLLAFSSLIPLTAIALSPPWAVTGRKSPEERSREAQDMVNAVLSHLEKGQHRHHPRRRKRHHHSRSDSSSSDDEKELLKESGHRRRARIEEVVQEDPSLFGLDSPDTITTSQMLLLAGFFLSLITWAFAYWRTILGGATGDTLVRLAQPNCTPGLGNVALLVVYANTLFMILAITALQVLLAAMSIMNLLDPSAKCLGRTSTAEYHGSQKLVFGASLLVWVVWFAATFYIWFAAGQANLLASLEFGWSFGTTFSILMLIIPIGSIVRTYRAKREENG
ncbi:hypothetical protein RHOSPDRAFT_32313 [Rhodotorula sp. JG-1b]|nr:hypothetical protein RHOSPDRAFT_32313 [Rhodotorula sp. JG-1b]